MESDHVTYLFKTMQESPISVTQPKSLKLSTKPYIIWPSLVPLTLYSTATIRASLNERVPTLDKL